MPRPVPIGEYQPQVPVEEGLRRVIPERTGISAGPAISELGESVQAVARSDAAVYVAKTLSAAQGQWTQELQNRQENAQPGAPGFTPALMKDYGTFVQQAVKQAPNTLAGRLVGMHLNEYGNQLQSHAMTFEANARHEDSFNSGTTLINSFGNQVLTAPNSFADHLATTKTIIDNLNLDPQNKDKLHRMAQSELAKAATVGAIQADPYAASQELISATPQKLYTTLLTPAEREELTNRADTALRQRVMDAERIEALTHKQQEAEQQDLIKQGLVLSQTGRLTNGWINQHQNLLTYEQMHFLMGQAGPMDQDKAQSDLHIYSDLFQRSVGGEDVSQDAQRMLFAGKLSKNDYARITEASLKDQPNWFKRGNEYIHTALQVSQLEPDPAKAQSLANAQNDWQDWSKGHPQATEDDAQKAYMGIVDRYQLVKGEQSMLVLPAPTFLIGSRAAPDIKGTSKATVDAFKAGQISRDEFDRQAALLQRWNAAVTAAQKRKADAAARK